MNNADATTNPISDQNFEFIKVLRAVAALLVVYDHLVATWLALHTDITWAPANFIKYYIVGPLDIVQDFGALGVIIFFFISGFIITHTAQREIRATFAIKRVMRIYPPLAGSILVISLLTNAHILNNLGFDHVNLPDFLSGLTLANYLTGTPTINAVAWTLLIEVLFYGLCVVVLPPIKSSPRLAVAINLGVCSLLLLGNNSFAPLSLYLAGFVDYIPYLICGQLIYYIWCKRIKWPSFVVLAIACYFVNAFGKQLVYPARNPAQNPYSVASIYGFGIFALLLLLNAHVKAPRLLRFFATISFSLYLYHDAIGSELLSRLIPHFGYTFGLAGAFSGCVIVSYLSWRFIEKPSQQLARAIIKRLKWLWDSKTAPKSMIMQLGGNSQE